MKSIILPLEMKRLFYFSASLIALTILLQQLEFVLAPLALALVFSICLSPVVNFLVGKKWNKTLSTLLVSTVFMLILLAFVTFISKQYFSIINGLPNLEVKAEALIKELLAGFTELTGMESKDLMKSLEDSTGKIQSMIGSLLGSIWSSVTNLISFLFVLPVFMVLILLYKERVRKFMVSFLACHSTEEAASKTVGQIKKVVLNYTIGLAIVIVILAVLNTIGLLILGIPFAIALGISSAALTVIPYIGILMGGGLAVIVAFATKDLNSVFYVIVLFALVQVLEGNFITPKIQGNQLDLNMLSVIVALMLGAFVWGMIGMILAVPAAAVLKVLLGHYDSTKMYAQLMSDDS